MYTKKDSLAREKFCKLFGAVNGLTKDPSTVTEKDLKYLRDYAMRLMREHENMREDGSEIEHINA